MLKAQPIQRPHSLPHLLPRARLPGSERIKFDPDRTAPHRLRLWQLEGIAVAVVVECAGGIVGGELADCVDAVGVFGAAGEGVEDVDAVEVVG